MSRVSVRPPLANWECLRARCASLPRPPEGISGEQPLAEPASLALLPRLFHSHAVTFGAPLGELLPAFQFRAECSRASSK